MLDDDDLDFAILAAPIDARGGWGIALTLAFLVAIIVIAIAVYGNHDECATAKCAHGTGALVNGACVCLESPVSK